MGRTRLTNWHAKRSGAYLTVNGIDAATSERVVVTEIVDIRGPAIASAPAIAVRKDSTEYELV